MKTICITEEQAKRIKESTSKTTKWNKMLNEESGKVRKKVMAIINDNCNRMYCQPYLMTPLSDVPSWLHDMCNPAGQEQGAWLSVKNNQNGMNRFIDFLVLNLKGQVGISHGNGPEQYLVGIARILCQDLGFYSFGENMNGGAIIKFSKLMKLLDKEPEFMLDGEVLDQNLNGMTYQQIMTKFGPKLEEYTNQAKGRLSTFNGNSNGHYRVVAISDTVDYRGMVSPDMEGQRLLERLDNYTDWCVCGPNGLWEYSQYLSNGGKLYIVMKDGFENVPKEQGENCPLDEYGLSLIAVIVGADGLPDNITTRWNHEFGGENHSGLWNAEQLQDITGLNYLATFKPRSEEDLQRMHLSEEKKPSAMDQVHNKVNAGIMDAVTCGGMMEESNGNLETWYRGYNGKYGSDYTHLLWLTSVPDYARAYGNRVEEVVIDMNKLNPASLYKIDAIVGYEFDYYDGISEEEAEKAMEEGIGGYYFEVTENEGYECLCIWDKSAIVSRRELPKEEFDAIEKIDGYDNPEYDAVLAEEIEDINTDIIHSDEFKSWFGDWENNPESASKVVDENGYPLVVHHGSPKFYGDTFDKEYIGHSINGGEDGVFCTTADYSWAKRFSYPAGQGSSSFTVKLDYSKPGDILSGFLNMRHPLDLTNLKKSDIVNMFKMHIKYDEFGKAFVEKYGEEKYYKKFVNDIKECLHYKNHQLIKHYIHRNLGDALKEFGYDGYIALMDTNDAAKEYCFVDPSQFKSIRKLSLAEKEPDMLNENSNDRKVNKYIAQKFGLTDFQDIRNKVMEIYEKIPYARVNGGQYMLGVLRLLFEENLPREDYGVLNKILYKLNYTYGADRQLVNDGNLGGLSFEQLKEKYFIPDFEGDNFSTAKKIVKLPNGYTVTRIDTYDEMNARCDGEWCISYDENMWLELIPNETVYLVENEELIEKDDIWSENNPKAAEDIHYMAGEEDDMMEAGYLNSDLAWTNKLGSWKFPYDYYGLSRFVVLVGEKGWLTVYSRYNMPNEFDGDYLTKGQLEKYLGVNFNDIFKYVPKDYTNGHYDNYGRWRVQQEVAEGSEPESDRYTIGGEGGNNEYFHALNESIAKKESPNFKKYFKPLTKFMEKEGLKVKPYPKVKLNWDEQDGLFIKTGYYEPDSKTIVVFCANRNPKDILRSFAHEMIHHVQNNEGVELNFSSKDDVKDNERLEKVEADAYLRGNIYFRKWTEYENKNRDVLQEGRKKVVKNDEGKIVPEKCDKCGGEVVCQIHGEPVYVCKDCGKYFGTVPFTLKEEMGRNAFFAKVQTNYAKEQFGITNDLNSAGFILIDGELLDFGRYDDILRKSHVLFDVRGANKYEFMNNGNIRIQPQSPGIEFVKEPTDKQYNIILKAVQFWSDRESFFVDCIDKDGNNIWNKEYKGAEKENIVKNIKNYFANGDNPTDNGNEVLAGHSLSDFLEENINPDDIDLSSFNIKTELNPKFWKDGRLDSRIRMKLLDIADDFIEFLGVDWVKPDDIIMTGSLANYNWNKNFSDIDLHILMDYTKVDKRTDFVSNYFHSQKKLWNEEHKDIKIFGFPVELYVQDTHEKHSSTGIYSLDKDKWLVEPERDKLSKSKINKSHIKTRVAHYIDKIDKLLTIYKIAKDDEYKIRKISERAEKVFDDIKAERKSGLNDKDCEITNGNLIFKCLRRMGYIEKIVNLMSDTYDKMNSLP